MLAINILGRFLLNTDKNIRYVALNTLLKVVHIDLNSIQRHRPTIIECLKDPDVSLKRRAMELCFALINRTNVVEMIDQLMDFLATCEPEFKADCSSNMFIAMEKYAVNQNWHVDQMMRVLKTAGNHIRDDIVSSFITLISNMNDFQFYTMNHLVKLIQDDITQQPLVQVAVWCLGEYGDRYSTVNEHDDEQNLSVDDMVNLLIRVLNYNAGVVATREYAMNALVKLSTRYPQITEHIQPIMSIYGCNMNLELQQRAVEYNAILKRYENLREGLFEQMPPIEIKTQNDLSAFQDEDDEQQQEQQEYEQAPSGDANKRKEEATKTLLEFFDDEVPTPTVATSQTANKIDSVNILDLLDEPQPTVAAAKPAPSASKAANNNLDSLFSLDANIPSQQTSSVAANPLNDLFGLGQQPVQAKAQPVATNSNNLDILDIFGGPSGAGVNSVPSSLQPQSTSNNLDDLLGFGGSTITTLNNDLFDTIGSTSTSTNKPANTNQLGQTPSANRTLVIYDKNELKLTLEPSSKSRNSLEQINLEMKANNSSLMHTVNEFLFSAAVPKTMQMQLSPPTSNQILPLDFVTQSILVWNPKQVNN